MRLFRPIVFFALLGSGCGTLGPKAAESKSDSKPVAKSVCETPRDRKPTATAAPFLLESFRCSMQPSPSLNVGIRVYSSIDGRETTLIYGPDRMDSPPVENDSFMYLGVKVVLAGTAEGRTRYSFQHPKISLQITVPRSSSKSDVFEASYSEEAGANDVKGACTRVSSVTY